MNCDCDSCRLKKAIDNWVPPAPRYVAMSAMPEGSVCVYGDNATETHWSDVIWTRNGTVSYVSHNGMIREGNNRLTDMLETGTVGDFIDDMGLPKHGKDINIGGVTTEEFWTDGECNARAIRPSDRALAECYLPCFGFAGDTAHRLVTLLRRFIGYRLDGVEVSGWIVKPRAVNNSSPMTKDSYVRPHLPEDVKIWVKRVIAWSLPQPIERVAAAMFIKENWEDEFNEDGSI